MRKQVRATGSFVSAAIALTIAGLAGCSEDTNSGANQDRVGTGTGGLAGNAGTGSGGKAGAGTGGKSSGGSGGKAGAAATGGAAGKGPGGSGGKGAGGAEKGDARPDALEAGCGTHLIYFTPGCGAAVRPTCTDYELCSDFVRCGCDGLTKRGCLGLLEQYVHDGPCEDGGPDAGNRDSGTD